MLRVLINLLALVVCCFSISSCIPYPLYTDENVRKTEWVIKRLVLDKASYTEVIAKLGTPAWNRLGKDKHNNVAYLICQTTGGTGILIFPPYPAAGDPGFFEFRGDEECFEYILEFDSNDILTGYKKNASNIYTSIEEYLISTSTDSKITKYDVIHSMAVKGIPESQWRLYDEFGKKSDDIVWLCRSADSGYKKAQLEVGHIYWASSNIPQHRIKAFIWYKQATSGDKNMGYMDERTTQNIATKAIHNAVNTMSQDQLLEAYNLYLTWEKGICEQELVE